MKYTMSMAASKEELTDMIMSDANMTDMEKLRVVFAIDKENLKGKFPQLYYAILAVLDREKKPDSTKFWEIVSDEYYYRDMLTFDEIKEIFDSIKE